MKKILFSILVLIAFSGLVNSATNGVGTWILQTEKISVFQIVYATITDAETFTIPKFNGVAIKIVITTTANDADGTLAIKDLSGVNYLSLPATTFSASSTVPINYVVPSVDQNSNVYGGQIVAGKHTGTLTNMAGAGATIITIYFSNNAN